MITSAAWISTSPWGAPSWCRVRRCTLRTGTGWPLSPPMSTTDTVWSSWGPRVDGWRRWEQSHTNRCRQALRAASPPPFFVFSPVPLGFSGLFSRDAAKSSWSQITSLIYSKHNNDFLRLLFGSLCLYVAFSVLNTNAEFSLVPDLRVAAHISGFCSSSGLMLFPLAAISAVLWNNKQIIAK